MGLVCWSSALSPGWTWDLCCSLVSSLWLQLLQLLTFSPGWTLDQHNSQSTFSRLSVDPLTNTLLYLPCSDAPSLCNACTAVTSSFLTEQTFSYRCSLTRLPTISKKVHVAIASLLNLDLLLQTWQERIQRLCFQREVACFWKGAHAWKLKTALSRHWIYFSFFKKKTLYEALKKKKKSHRQMLLFFPQNYYLQMAFE